MGTGRSGMHTGAERARFAREYEDSMRTDASRRDILDGMSRPGFGELLKSGGLVLAVALGMMSSVYVLDVLFQTAMRWLISG